MGRTYSKEDIVTTNKKVMARILRAILLLLPLVSGSTKIDFTFEVYDQNCDCKIITECYQLNELAAAKKWDELKNNYTICGFDRKVPKFCCPPDDQKRTPKHSNINGYNDLILEETSELMNNVFTGVIELEKKLLEKNKKDNVAPPILSDIVPEIASNIIPEAVSEVAPKMSADIIWIHRTTTKSTTTATEATKTTTESTTTTTKPTITTTTMSVEGISEEAIETSIDAKDVEEDIRPIAIPEHLTNIIPEVLSTEQKM